MLQRYLQRRIPIIKWLPKYSFGDNILSDAIAGLTVGLMIVPQSLAIVRIIGSSKDMSLGPTVLVAIASVKGNVFSSPIYSSIQAFMSGLFLLLMGLLNMGFLMNFFASSVISGFVSAASITIGISQLPTFLGILIHKASSKNPVIVLIEVFQNIGNAHIWDSFLSVFFLSCLLTLQQILQKIINPKMQCIQNEKRIYRVIILRILWFICVARIAIFTIIAIIFCYTIKISLTGSTMSIIGNLDSGLPILWNPFQSANVSITDSNNVATYQVKSVLEIFYDISISIPLTAIISMMEHLSVVKSFSRRFQYTADYSQELFASGFANMMTSFFRGFPIGSSLPRCAVNAAAGVKSPLSGIITCFIVVLTLIILTPVFAFVPRSLLAAIIISAVIPMFDYESVILLWRVRKIELVNWLVTFGAGLYSLEIGIAFGALSSICFILFREMRPRIKSHLEKNEDTIYITFNGGLHYPGADYLSEKVRKIIKKHGSRLVVLNCQNLFEIDVTVAMELKQILIENDIKAIKCRLINVKETSEVHRIFQNLNLNRFMPENTDTINLLKKNTAGYLIEKTQTSRVVDMGNNSVQDTNVTHTLCFDKVADSVVAFDNVNFNMNRNIGFMIKSDEVFALEVINSMDQTNEND